MKQANLSRTEILKGIEAIRKKRSDAFYSVATGSGNDVYKPILPDAVACFKNEIEAVNGQCVVCEDEKDIYRQLKDWVAERAFPYIFSRDREIRSRLEENGIPCSGRETDFENMQAGITGCEFLIARTGSVMVSSVSSFGRQMYGFPPVHIVVAKASQMTDFYEDALKALQHKYRRGNLPSAITTITGPSRTADIEKTLVLGAHGPKEIIVFIPQN